MLRKAEATIFVWLALAGHALAQTPTTPSTPGAAQTTAPTTAPTTNGMDNWIWLVVVVALIAAAIWFFMRRRSATRL